MEERKTVLDRLAATAEERILLARLWDSTLRCRQRNIPACSGFLSPHEQVLAERMLHAIGFSDGWVLWGGFDSAQRRQIHFLPDWAETPDTSAIRAIRCSFYETEQLTHRDVLGSLMALGITREKVGDILVSEHTADVLTGGSITDFLLQEWKAAGRVRLHTVEISLSSLLIPPEAVKLLHDTVASLRLDSVLAAGFSISRSEAAELIRGGKAEVNWMPCDKPDALVQQGDVLTARGCGKCQLAEIGGQSRKGRTAITLKRYI